MNCLICRIPVQPDDECLCATRKTDGAPVCPECTQLVRTGNRDALDKLYGAREVHGD